MKFLVFSFLFNFTILIYCVNRKSLFLELDNTTIEDFISSNENVLIIFRRDNCPSCDNIVPHIIELERRIITLKMNVKIATINDNYKEVIKKYDVMGFPSIKFFNRNYNIKENYLNEINTDSLINFITDKMKVIWQEIYSVEHFQMLEKSNRILLLVCGSKITFPDIFPERQVIRSINEDLELYFSRDRKLYKTLGCELNDIIIIKNYDEGKSLYKYDGYYNRTDFHSWLELYSFPLVLELNDDNIQMAMQKHLPTVILIQSSVLEPSLDKLIYESASRNRVKNE